MSKFKTHKFTLFFEVKNRFIVITLLENPKGPVELGNLNTCAEVKLCCYFFMPALEIGCRETEVLK